MEVKNTVWDLRVVAADNAASVIAYVPRWTSIEFSDQLNDIGSARVVHDFNDPFFDNFQNENGQSLLTGPYALQIVRNNTPVYTFFIDDVQVDRAAETQPLILSGRGIGSALEWAVVLPENFSGETRVGSTTSSRPKFFDRLFPGYDFVVRCATTANLSATYASGPSTSLPGVGARLTASVNGFLNTTGIDGITDFVVGDTVLVKNQTNSAHNGVYWIAELGSLSSKWVLQRVATCDASPVTDMAAGRTAFVIEGSTNGYTAWTMSVASTFTSATQIGTIGITFSSLTSGSHTGIGAFCVLFNEADTGYEYLATKDVNWNTQFLAAGRGGPSFAVDWPLSLDSNLVTNLGLLDSKNQIVQDGGTFSIPVGRTMLEVLKQATEQTQTDWHVSATGVISISIRPFSRNGVVKTTPFGTDRTTGSAAKLFTLPMFKSAETKTSSAARRTVVFGSDGRQLDRLVSDSSDTYGIRESYFENTADDAPAVANLTASAIRKIDGGKLQVTTSFAEIEGFVAWQDFEVGDKVLVEIEVGVYVERIIAAISSQISANGDKSVEITFGEVFADVATDLASAAGFGSLNASELATFSGKPANVFLSAPTSTSIVPLVSGLSNRAVINWDASNSGRVSQYEVTVFRENQQLSGGVYVSIVYQATSLERSGNICTLTFSSAHGIANGDTINVYTVEGFGGYGIPVLSVPNNTTIKYENQGPDDSVISINPYVAEVTKVVESTSVIVDGTKSSAAVENLSAPGREYLAVITPFNEYGIAGESSETYSFTSSTSPLTLLDSNIQSSNFVTGVSGWRISADGSAQFNGGSFSVTSIDIGGSDTTSFHVDTAGNMWSGAATYASATFRVSSGGSMRATAGDIAGWSIVGNNLESGAGYTGSMSAGPTAYSGAPAYVVEYTSGRVGRLFGGNLELYHGNGGFIDLEAGTSTITVTNNITSSTMDESSVVSNNVYAGTLHANGAAGVYIGGIGFSYQDVSIGPGNHNWMALEWTGSNAFVAIDNAAIEYLNDSLSDRRIKRNIAEPEEYWTNKLLNDVKIWQFNKINPLNDWDEHVYPLQLGVMADEFKEVFPQWESSSLFRDPDGADADKIRSVNYSALIPPLVLTVQKLNERIKVLEQQLGV